MVPMPTESADGDAALLQRPLFCNAAVPEAAGANAVTAVAETQEMKIRKLNFMVADI